MYICTIQPCSAKFWQRPFMLLCKRVLYKIYCRNDDHFESHKLSYKMLYYAFLVWLCLQHVDVHMYIHMCIHMCVYVYQDFQWRVTQPSKVELAHVLSKNAMTTEGCIHLGMNLATPLLKTTLNTLFILRYGSF